MYKLRHATTRRLGNFVCVRAAGSVPSSEMVSDTKDKGKSAAEIRLDNHTQEESIYALGKHRSNALELVHRVPIVEVDGEMAVCDGGGGAMGHPIEYISLARPGSVEYCKYCSIRFTQKQH